MIHKRYGPDYLTEDQEQILLEEGIQVLIDRFPDL
jgi:hypothetical protein